MSFRKKQIEMTDIEVCKDSSDHAFQLFNDTLTCSIEMSNDSIKKASESRASKIQRLQEEQTTLDNIYKKNEKLRAKIEEFVNVD